MAPASKGDKVKVHYTGTFKENGEVFDSSRDGEPLEFVLGEGMVIAGFEGAVLGLNPGESVSVEIAPEDGYGHYNEQLAFEVRREQLPPEVEPELNMMLEVRTEEGEAAYVTVTEVNDETVTLDGNHPLADKVLKFDVELVEIV
ncbi:FKBP-type peptidyl-prolyl cis-trans isomerase [Pseudodesulfovibrio senegalensis]|jgi:peptidylprolyl isomerase|uniref:Peptidyl-prolyl cis-trans isomerase n=1 Tax=Pseudodesulfovibrio senegalensis TaxID=1721087 RepID=A0A6N6N4E3_9BACT|nr:peptidylprolyl isomerase [Pseudodesulfovibrio senegalensis]KAB1442088.1 peptidylprolyl isomerase [Pseudodesulfovibrio senegalensis]